MSEGKRQSTAASKRAALSGREHARSRRIAFWLIVFLILVAAFLGGFLLRSNVSLMESLGISTGEVSQPTAPGTTKVKTTFNSLSARISEVEDLLSTYSFDDVDLGGATDLVLTGLMEATKDPYAVYYTEERYQAYMKENADRGFGGIGVLFGDYDGRAYAIDVLSGSEAQAEGIQQGDFVQAIGGDASHPWSAAEVIGAISQHTGEDIVISWMRPVSIDAKTGKEFTTTLSCKEYESVNVTSELRDGVGYIKIRQITGNSAQLVESAVEDLSEQGALAFVLDVSDNPGGYLTQALDIASLFVPSGVLVGIETPDGNSTRTATGSTITTAPLVVIANQYTSGVAEVLTAALQDNQRATVVGEKTIGKGSVQVTRELTFGGAIRYTGAYYLTPQGRDINGVGVAPNIEVASASEGEENMQLAVALVTARSMIPA